MPEARLNNMVSPSSTGPGFAASVLQAIARTLSKRQKSIKRRSRQFSLERVIERDPGGDVEKLEFTFVSAIGAAQFRLFVWEDSYSFVDIRQIERNAGWVFEWTGEGRLGGSTSLEISKAIFESIEVTCSPTKNGMERLDAAWSPLLKKGPIKL